MASSTALSTTSQTRWCRPRSPVEPMYIPGRLRTASRPSKTLIEIASYATQPSFCRRIERLPPRDTYANPTAYQLYLDLPVQPGRDTACRVRCDPYGLPADSPHVGRGLP